MDWLVTVAANGTAKFSKWRHELLGGEVGAWWISGKCAEFGVENNVANWTLHNILQRFGSCENGSMHWVCLMSLDVF